MFCESKYKVCTSSHDSENNKAVITLVYVILESPLYIVHGFFSLFFFNLVYEYSTVYVNKTQLKYYDYTCMSLHVYVCVFIAQWVRIRLLVLNNIVFINRLLNML